MPITRRDFVRTGAIFGAAAVLPAPGQAPAVVTTKAIVPVVIASANGNQFKNGGERTCVHEAWERMTAGEDFLDAILAGVRILELDPEEDSVGYGGLRKARAGPNFQLKFYAVSARGEFAGVAMYEGPEKVQFAVCDANGPRTVPMDFLLPGAPTDPAAKP